MTRIGKLYEQARHGRDLSFLEFCRLMVAFGYELDRTRGSHIVYRHRSIADKRVVQPLGKAAKTYQVTQFFAIVDTHGLTLDD